MSVAPSTPIPAGWYPDPAGSFQQRWWTGSAWTNDFAQYRPPVIHSAPTAQLLTAAPTPVEQASTAAYLAQQAAATVHSTGPLDVQYTPTQTLVREPVVDPLPVFRLPDADQPPLTIVAQQQTQHSAASNDPALSYDPGYSSNYKPFEPIPQVRRGHRITPRRRFTAAVWLLALVPVAFVGAAYAVAVFLPVLYSGFVLGAVGAVFLAIGLGLAVADRHVLYIDGHDSTASPAIAILTPLAYLVARTVIVSRETGRNALAPLLLLLAGIAGVAAALVLVSGLLPLLTTITAP